MATEKWVRIEGGVTAARGFKANGVESGIKKNGGLDLALVVATQPATAAGVFTTNKVAAAPVIVSKEHLANGQARAVLLNSGNANACLGEEGMNTARSMAEQTGKALGVSADDVLVASTGVIGVAFPLEKALSGIEPLVHGLTTTGGHTAARAIMTTDTVSKEIALEFTIQGQSVRIGGMAKGSGMIQPNMATMLSVVTTDLDIPADLLKRALLAAARVTFNRITVDGDMSTNDSLFLLANGASGVGIHGDGADFDLFQAALTEVCKTLARMCVSDGEGATKLIDIVVKGARSEEDAERAARSVANSSLVKTAFFGEDANWGRILCAVGYSGIMFDPAKTIIALGDLVVFEKGTGLAFDEEKAAKILAEKEIQVLIELGEGDGEATVWTCDFSYDYVKINGSYRT
jgi:glutamate N-acetyltransferase/amino-acid N-acetyltransferase